MQSMLLPTTSFQIKFRLFLLYTTTTNNNNILSLLKFLGSWAPPLL